MRFFIAGIMQGSHVGLLMHGQDYRGALRTLLAEAFPTAEIYDPLANHNQSIKYDDELGRSVFFGHNRMCGEVDVVVAFVPEASMGTAIEMWEAFRHGRVVLTISPLAHNWAVKFLSHKVYGDFAHFTEEVSSGRLAAELADLQAKAHMAARSVRGEV